MCIHLYNNKFISRALLFMNNYSSLVRGIFDTAASQVVGCNFQIDDRIQCEKNLHPLIRALQKL